MAENKNKVQPGRVLSENNGVVVYELETGIPYWNGVADFEQVTAAFNTTGVAVRVVPGTAGDELSLRAPAQIVLTREVFAKLIASYRAYERMEKKAAVEIAALAPAPVGDDYDPFLDLDDSE
jgi:siroheme synthase